MVEKVIMKSNIEKANQYIKDNKHKVKEQYRHLYHFMGEVGWINDPNGFSMYDGEYHLFFQYHPYSSEWGPMHWGHAKSKDLIKWTHLPVALAPVEEGPEGGAAFSGSALEHRGEHLLMYTENWNGVQVQNIAKSKDGIHYLKLSDKPVITSDMLPKYASKKDFRDPKIWIEDEVFYSLVSSRNDENNCGQLLLYSSNDFLEWSYERTLVKSDGTIGEMWECPDLFTLNNHEVLIVSPQYMKSKGEGYQNLHSSIYMLGNYDKNLESFDFKQYCEIDSGFDFYAPQTLLDDKNRRIMIAWMSMWERNMPTNDLGHKWAGSMTIPRVLTTKNGKLIQTPIDEIKKYRIELLEVTKTVSGMFDTDVHDDVCELDVSITNLSSRYFGLELMKSQDEKVVLMYDVENKLLSLDRSNTGYPICGNELENNSNIRKTAVDLMNDKLSLRMFLDKSSIEVFIQDGVKTMTSLFYPKSEDKGISLFAYEGEAMFDVKKWKLKR